MPRPLLSVLLMLSLVSLASCSKTPSGSSASASSPTASATSSSDLPTADLTTPDSAYTSITQPNQVWLMYAALSSGKVDDELLSNVSPAYLATSGPFQRRDLLAKLTPGVEADFAAAKDHRYVTFTDRSGHLAPYNFDHKAFGLASSFMNGDASVSHGQMAGVSLIDVLPTNAADFQWLDVLDQNKAQALQAKISAGWLPQVKVWAYVQGASKMHGITRTLFVQITKIQVLEPQGQIALEQTAKGD